MLSPQEVLKQSQEAFFQWGKQWKEHAKKNGDLMRKIDTKLSDLAGEGAGRKLLCLAMGPSLKPNLEIIAANQKNVDIICVDKAFGLLVDHGIIPKYVVLADANVSAEKYLAKWVDKTDGVILLANINGNVKWPHAWKGQVFFYVNKDNIESERIFCQISGCQDQIVASSNVGNTCVVLATSLLGYDRVLLCGYDSCWYPDSEYYAGEESEKRYWMKHHYFVDTVGRLCYTSANLLFSSRWLDDYIVKMRMENRDNVVNCSGGGLSSAVQMPLHRMIDRPYDRKISDDEKQRVINARLRIIEGIRGNDALNKAVEDNYVHDCVIRHIRRLPQFLAVS